VETALPAEDAKRFIYLDRRVCSVTPGRIDVHPARSIVILPLLTLLLGLAAFPVIYFGGSSLSVELRFALTLFALFLVPLSGLGVVYSIAGAHIVVERHKQSAVLQQGYLGMGVGTEELIPFWKMDKIIVEETMPGDIEFAQYEVGILKLSGRFVTVATVTTPRAGADEGLSRADDVATLIAGMAGVPLEHTVRDPNAERDDYDDDIDDDDNAPDEDERDAV
jgi:hypothetical protein